MIRRWSYLDVANLNKNLFNHTTFIKLHKRIVFRSAVNFKRFTFKYSKFKRRTLSRWKHLANWSLYLNILRTWVEDFQINRQLLRSQFYASLFTCGFVSYVPSCVDAKYIHLLAFTNCYSTVSSEALKASSRLSRALLTRFALWTLNYTFSFLPTHSLLSFDKCNVFGYSYQQQVYCYALPSIYNCDDLYLNIFNAVLKCVIEAYKILLFLHYSKIYLPV